MIKNNKWKLILSSVIILIPSLVGVVLEFVFKNTDMADKLGFGELGSFLSPFIFSAIIGIILLLSHVLCICFTLSDNKANNQNKKLLNIIFYICPVLSIYSSAMYYALLFGYRPNISAFIAILAGPMFILLGNYMPKSKQNHTIGIRIPWTLASEDNWNKTHRFSGKLFVIIGLIILPCALLPIEILSYIFVILILCLTVVPILYSYVYYKNQLKNENSDIKTEELPVKKKSKLTIICGSLILLTSIVVVIVICFTGDVSIRLDESSFTLKASFWTDTTIKYDSIESIEYRESDTPGHRVNGVGSPRILAGIFSNEEFNTYTRYSYTESKECIVIKAKSRIIVMSFADDSTTRDIYQQLIQNINTGESEQ